MSRTTVTAPGVPTTDFIYCDKCRKGEPFQTRRAGWRIAKDGQGKEYCPDCKAPVVRLNQNPCKCCGTDMLPGTRAYRVAVGYVSAEDGLDVVELAAACTKRCAHDLLKGLKHPAKQKGTR